MLERLYFAQKGFILHEGKLLLVRKSLQSPVHPGKWEVPGGRLESEESLQDHLCREIYEETGIQAEVIEPFYVWDWYLDAGQNRMRVVAAAVLCRTAQVDVTLANQVAGDNLAEFAWVPVEELLSFDLIPNMIPVMERFLKKYCQNVSKIDIV